MKQQAQLVSDNKKFVALGQVSSYQPDRYMVQVIIQPADGSTEEDTPALQTGWIPLMSPWVGSGWGMFAPPNIGDIIEVHFQEGSLQNGYACLRAYTVGNPPASVQSGEFWLVHQTGSSIKITNDGAITINANAAINVTAASANVTTTGTTTIDAPTVNVNASTAINLNSTVVNIGDLTSGTLLDLMNSTAIAIYNSHTHNVLSTTTNIPNQQITSSLTQNVKAT